MAELIFSARAGCRQMPCLRRQRHAAAPRRCQRGFAEAFAVAPADAFDAEEGYSAFQLLAET